MNPRPRIWPVVLLAMIGVLILCGLGFWQVQRLAYKQALLGEIDRRGMADPIDLSEAAKHHASGENVEFLKAAAQGRFLHHAEKLMIATLEGNAAWEVVTPLLTADNILVLVDRGLVPDEQRNPATR
ncbi:MAG: SURF1 family protein, partial [Methylocella sp.]